MKKDCVVQFPQYSEAVRTIAKQAKHSFARGSEEPVQAYLEFDLKLPSQYGWRQMHDDAFTVAAAKCNSIGKLNKVYWVDFARNIEAYNLMTYWRGAELMKPMIRSLNLGEIVPAAILGRSLLELAATHLWNANHLQLNVPKLPIDNENLVLSKEMEEFCIKAIWGTRMSEPPSHLKKGSVLTTIQKISRNKNATDLYPVYEYLCELAHPNVIGYARFWANIERTNDDGSKLIKMERTATTGTYEKSAENALWALGWSAACLLNAYGMIHDAVAVLDKKTKPLA